MKPKKRKLQLQKQQTSYALCETVALLIVENKVDWRVAVFVVPEA